MAGEADSTTPTEVIQAPVPEISKAVAESLEPKALEFLKKTKAAKAAKVAPVAAAEPVVEAAAKPAKEAKAAPAADDALVIDLSDLGKEPGKPVEAAPIEDDLTGLDESARKKIEDKNKENARIRKRAQEAEELVKTKDTEILTHKEQVAAAKEELQKLKDAPPVSSNTLGRVTDPRWVDYYEADAKEQLRKLNRAVRDPETDLNHKFADGTVRELTTSDYDLATAIVEDAPLRRTQLQNFTKSQKAVAPIANAFGAVPEWATAHSAVNARDWATDKPEIAALAAIGQLVHSGAWTLVKKSAKAAEATSSATTGAGANAPSKTATAPKEVAQSQPQAARTDAGPVAIPSALRERAMKGDESAVLEMLKLKAQARKMQTA